MKKTPDSNWALRFPADCSIAAIRSVYDLVQDAFKRQDGLEIDCSSVDKADVTSVQLLLSATKTADRQGRRVVLTAISQALRATLQRAGFVNDAMIDRHFRQRNDGA